MKEKEVNLESLHKQIGLLRGENLKLLTEQNNLKRQINRLLDVISFLTKGEK